MDGNVRAGARGVTVVMADDDPDDRMLVKDAFAQTHPACSLHFVDDGEQLLDYLSSPGNGAPYPCLILLDLNMPKKDGRQALAEIKSDRNLKCIPVVIFTTSNAENDVLRTYDLGASSFITKPSTFESLVNVIRMFGIYWAETVELPIRHGPAIPKGAS